MGARPWLPYCVGPYFFQTLHERLRQTLAGKQSCQARLRLSRGLEVKIEATHILSIGASERMREIPTANGTTLRISSGDLLPEKNAVAGHFRVVTQCRDMACHVRKAEFAIMRRFCAGSTFWTWQAMSLH